MPFDNQQVQSAAARFQRILESRAGGQNSIEEAVQEAAGEVVKEEREAGKKVASNAVWFDAVRAEATRDFQSLQSSAIKPHGAFAGMGGRNG